MNTVQYVGIDISKDTLQIDWGTLSGPALLPNTPAGIKRLLKLVAAHSDTHVVCEATGGYERVLLHALWAEDRPVTLFNPKRVRDFARGTNRLAKTDSIDARVIRDYAITLKPSRTLPPSSALIRLKDLCSRRDDLLTQRLAEANRSRMLSDKVLLRQSRCLLKQLDSHIADLERWMRETIDADPSLSAKLRTLCSVKGVGFIVAVSVLGYLPEIGSLNRRSCAALAGVAPFNRDSGLFRGQRRITAGRFPLRRVLYMAALVAARSNPLLREFYLRLTTSSAKPRKLALTALMRKLLIHLNSLLKPLSYSKA